MARHRLAAAIMTACGLSAAAAGWLLPTASQPRPVNAGFLPPDTHRPAADTGADASPPTHIRGPKDFEAAVVPVAATGNGALALPEDPRTGGWWPLGATVGSRRGTVLIAGHVDTRRHGFGPFAALHDMPLGARIEVVGADDHIRAYRITARRTYPQEKLPTDLFTRSGTHRLALITCTGPYDRTTSRYQQNLVLYGTPIAPDGRVAHRETGTRGPEQPR
ncbi:class F sortase [Streptomyces sp. CB03234]|uniref:class F sortase n=1 Tax=Streptomyces sp. (strain CB03234) TaxID=1703937 RepID=UPI0009A1F70B|nr:class F sortase [Streptomyces sp. CB03234]